jgi:hypothetical protein
MTSPKWHGLMSGGVCKQPRCLAARLFRMTLEGVSCPCKAPGDQVHKCNFLLRSLSPGAPTGIFSLKHPEYTEIFCELLPFRHRVIPFLMFLKKARTPQQITCTFTSLCVTLCSPMHQYYNGRCGRERRRRIWFQPVASEVH